jgi:hypothetical protein
MLTQLDFLSLIWLFPIALALHELEEWNIIHWYHSHFVDLPDKTQTSTRFFLVFVSLVGFVWTGIAAWSGEAPLAAYILFSFLAIVFLNCAQHIYWQILFKTYAPGILTSVFLLLPVIGILVYRALAENLISIWYVLLLFVVIVPGFVDTLRAGNTLTPQFFRIHRFSKRMVKRLRLE